MRIATLLPTSEHPMSRGYALWCRSAEQVTNALEQRGVEVHRVAVQTAPGQRAEARSAALDEARMFRIGEPFRNADQFDVIHTMVAPAGLSFAAFVQTPVLATVWHDMWRDSADVFEQLDGTVFYLAPSAGDRSKVLRYTDTIPWGQDLSSVPLSNSREQHLVYVGSLDDTTAVQTALKLAAESNHALILVGEPSEPQRLESVMADYRDRTRIEHIAEPMSEAAERAVATALAVVHTSGSPGFDQLALVDAAARGTPVLCLTEDQTMPCLVPEKSSWHVPQLSEAISVLQSLGEIDRDECRKSVLELYDLSVFVPALIEVYEQIIRRASREDHRPWGYYTVLADEPDHKVKRIVVYPDKRLSLQRHQHRSEHWFILKGEGLVTLDEEELRLLPGQSIEIPKGCWHRMRNPTNENLAFIEVQTGDYFGEDDIERAQDDYGRV